jgi:photosystem II stability/assembly factor-like uncharacterized protein
MKIGRAILLLFLLGFAASAVRPDWQKRESGSLAWLYAVQFLDANIGFAAGSNGTLLATGDAGVRWKKLDVPVTDTIRDVHFLDRSNGWMLCDRGKLRSGKNPSYLLRTADSGKTWSQVEFKNSTERYGRLFFSANGVGYLVGEGGVISGLPTDERAETRSILPVRFLMVDGVVLGDSKIFLAGGGGSLISSDDLGRNWHTARLTDLHPASKLNAIFFADRQIGWVAGNSGKIFSTDDGGRSWQWQTTGTEADIFDIAFYDRKTGFAVGDAGTVLRTTDAGVSWRAENNVSKHRLERLAFAGRRAIAVGFGGTIISTDLP